MNVRCSIMHGLVNNHARFWRVKTFTQCARPYGAISSIFPCLIGHAHLHLRNKSSMNTQSVPRRSVLPCIVVGLARVCNMV
jgi:hypothetical protein